jgi:hypothetical protein
MGRRAITGDAGGLLALARAAENSEQPESGIEISIGRYDNQSV